MKSKPTGWPVQIVEIGDFSEPDNDKQKCTPKNTFLIWLKSWMIQNKQKTWSKTPCKPDKCQNNVTRRAIVNVIQTKIYTFRLMSEEYKIFNGNTTATTILFIHKHQKSHKKAILLSLDNAYARTFRSRRKRRWFSDNDRKWTKTFWPKLVWCEFYMQNERQTIDIYRMSV